MLLLLTSRLFHSSNSLVPLSTRLFQKYHTTTTSNIMSNGNTVKNLGGSIVRAADKIGLKQLFDEESSTFTYFLYDQDTKDAILVDPVDTQVDRDMKQVEGFNLVYGVNTHAHADHITGTGLLKQKHVNENGTSMKSVISKASGAQADLLIEHGDRIAFGHRFVTAKSTPGHTGGCMSYVADDESFVLTGDTLLIQGCGRTDFQSGSAATLYESVHSQLFSTALPDDCIVYPAHDYKGRTSSTIGAEKTTNPRLTKSKEEFVELMANLNLSYPKKLDVAVPANMRCGVPDV